MSENLFEEKKKKEAISVKTDCRRAGNSQVYLKTFPKA